MRYGAAKIRNSRFYKRERFIFRLKHETKGYFMQLVFGTGLGLCPADLSAGKSGSAFIRRGDQPLRESGEREGAVIPLNWG
jgi:hypothetical protein